jgi:hypothetical protein
VDELSYLVGPKGRLSKAPFGRPLTVKIARDNKMRAGIGADPMSLELRTNLRISSHLQNS